MNCFLSLVKFVINVYNFKKEKQFPNVVVIKVCFILTKSYVMNDDLCSEINDNCFLLKHIKI